MSPNNSLREITLLRLIDATADRFESAWQSGAQPRIEDFLADCAADLRPRLLAELLSMELEWRGQKTLSISSED